MTSEPTSARARMAALAAQSGLIEQADIAVVTDLVERAAALRPDLDDHALVGLVQAYGRAIDRIASAEADLAARHLADLPPERFEADLASWLASTLPLADEAFSFIHAHRAEQLIRRRTATVAGEEYEAMSEVSVAVVDLCGSTGYMLDQTPAGIAALVDELYFVSSEIAAAHEVLPGKFLGDGVMLFARDGGRLLSTTRETVHTLAERLPLRARAGCARGPVVRRAGDWFGTPVNLAARLGELASADEILVDEAALPAGVHPDTWRVETPRGLREARRIAVL